MEYIDVEWKHQSTADPVQLVSELNADRYETRKLEFFPMGRVGYASQQSGSPGIELGIVPVPQLTEINQSHEFNGATISTQGFESLWAANVSARA